VSFLHYYLHHIPNLLNQARHTLTWYFLTHYGVKRHARQLFLPWKRLYLSDQEKKQYGAWHILTFNVISRFMGFWVRSTIIIAGLVLATASQFILLSTILIWFLLLPIDFLCYLLKVGLDHHSLPANLNDTTAIISFLQKQPVISEVWKRADMSDEHVNAFYACLTDQPTPLTEEQQATLKAYRHLDEASLDILTTILSHPTCQSALSEQPLDQPLLLQTIAWVRDRVTRFDRHFHWYEKEAWVHLPIIGLDWAYGFTPTLDKFAQNLNEVVAKKTQVETRPEELQHLLETFANQENPAVLYVGDPGVGKKTLCFSLAQTIIDHRVPPALADHRVMLLDIDSVVVASDRPAEQLWLLSSIFAEASRAGNCIVVIDQIDRFVGGTFAEADFSSLLNKVGKEYRLKLIGLVTTSGFRQKITQNSLVMSGFDIRHLHPLTPDETLEVLKYVAYRYESDRFLITLPALQEIVKQSRQLLDHIPNPEKSLTLLDMTLAGLSSGKTELTKTDVLAILSKKVGIPLGGMTDQDREVLKSLESELSQRVIGQNRALKALASSVKRAALQLQQSLDKPKGSFLFLGPTGVGKTETAKALADIYFGSRDRMIRIDFGEYSSANSLANLIGASVGQSDHQAGGLLTEAIRQNPYSVVLFDELEKAHPSILTALLTVFDEGYLTDARGQLISFRHSFIIATSNAASQLLYAHSHQRSSDNQDEELTESEYTALHDQVIDNLITSQTFAPEFLNRFDGIILFSPLTRKQFEEIVQLKLKQIERQLLQEHQLKIQLSPEKLERIIQLAYSPTFGARNLERVLTAEVVDACAEKLLHQEVGEGGVVVLE